MDNETYTHEQAMVRLGLLSHNALNQLIRKYPHAFVVIHQGTGKKGKGSVTLYDKQSLDKFAVVREAIKQIGQP
jgi:hypothetical protein